jgi:chemotaxis protein methyltransferase CheR
MVEFQCRDIRRTSELEKKAYHLICCRNLAFTYFDIPVQREMEKKLHASLAEDGILMIGVHERLPSENMGLTAWSEKLGIYRRI